MVFSEVNLRDLFGVGTKLKENIFKNINQMNSTVTTRTWVLSTEWTRICGQVPDWYPNEKNGGVPHFFLSGRCCSSECVGIVSY